MTDTSKNYADVVKNIRTQARVFEAVIDLADELEALGSLNNAQKEATARLGKLRDEEAALAASVDGIKADIAKLTGKKSETAVKAQAALDGALADAEKIVAMAKSQAKELFNKAQASANSVIFDAQTRANDIDVKTSIARSKLDELNAEIAAKAQERTTLEKAIDAIKKKFS